ncbi:hypothetical protein PVK06_020523 [Gossypium arboreum]|uniref:Uncharacterized protein n=1 Tax=Gossypium arboreum TaxID=29729 RepID=A0ABR0PML1_GOSAR|nr:hypothetical protein PVK06_020523 [Gossypium arboreum]
MGYDKSVSSIMEKHGWQIFCIHPDNVLGKVAREFYAHITSSNNPFIYVRGISFPFDEDRTNAQFGLTDVQDKHTPFVENINAKGLNQVLKDLCVGGSWWTVSSQECHMVERTSLKSIGKARRAEEEPIEVQSDKVESANVRAGPKKWKVAEAEPKKTKIMNIESDEEEQNETTTVVKATEKGK